LDSRPRAYESPALPLSYLGVGRRAPQILLWEHAFVNVMHNAHAGSAQELIYIIAKNLYQL
jgi:hypothetical protein